MDKEIHSEEKIVLFVDGALNKIQRKELNKHLKYCLECKNIYSQYLSMKEETITFYKTVNPTNLKSKLSHSESTVNNKFIYAIMAIVFLIAIVSFFIPKNQSLKKISGENFIQEKQIDSHINEIEREINYIDNQLNEEIL